MSILFLGKKGDQYALDASLAASELAEDVTVCMTTKDEPFPDEILNWSGDWIISYLCQRVVPASLLEKARSGAINFHPGPPQYPGIGCTNFAIYNEEKEFGVTCHHMLPQVDSGKVVAVHRFPLLQEDSVLSLTKRCYSAIAQLYSEILLDIVQGRPLPQSGETWTRQPYTLKDFFELCRLTLDMDVEEQRRRIRATQFPGGHGPYFDINGRRFVLEGSKAVPR